MKPVTSSFASFTIMFQSLMFDEPPQEILWKWRGNGILLQIKIEGSGQYLKGVYNSGPTNSWEVSIIIPQNNLSSKIKGDFPTTFFKKKLVETFSIICKLSRLTDSFLNQINVGVGQPALSLKITAWNCDSNDDWASLRS